MTSLTNWEIKIKVLILTKFIKSLRSSCNISPQKIVLDWEDLCVPWLTLWKVLMGWDDCGAKRRCLWAHPSCFLWASSCHKYIFVEAYLFQIFCVRQNLFNCPSSYIPTLGTHHITSISNSLFGLFRRIDAAVRRFGQITSNFLTQASCRLDEIRQLLTCLI